MPNNDYDRIDVLDHGYVRLVSFMQPSRKMMDATGAWVNDPDWSGDLEVVRNARVSYDADWRTGDDEGKDRNLLQRLWENNHASPFEAMVFTFEVQAPIFTFRQWHRHWSWRYNEVSARYTELPELYYTPEAAVIGAQSKTNKQGRDLTDIKPGTQGWAMGMIAGCCDHAFFTYHQLLNQGIAREIARMVLPVNTYSRMFATVNLRSLLHFISLRFDAHAQYEIYKYAEALRELTSRVCPVVISIFDEMRARKLTPEEINAVLLAIDSYADDLRSWTDPNDDEDREDRSKLPHLESAFKKLGGKSE